MRGWVRGSYSGTYRHTSSGAFTNTFRLGELFLLEKIHKERSLPGSNLSCLDADAQDRSPLMSTLSRPSSPRESGTSIFRSLSPSNRKSEGYPFLRRNSCSSSSDEREQSDHTMSTWLKEGNVIYKSVGFDIMDIIVGLHLIKLAREKGIGHFVDGF